MNLSRRDASPFATIDEWIASPNDDGQVTFQPRDVQPDAVRTTWITVDADALLDLEAVR